MYHIVPYTKHRIINESISFHQELGLLVSDILDEYTGRVLTSDSLSGFNPHLYLPHLIENNPGHYHTLREFLVDSGCVVTFEPHRNDGVSGRYVPPDDTPPPKVILYYKKEQMDRMFSVKNGDSYPVHNHRKVIRNLMDGEFGTILTHELTHVYDDHRAGSDHLRPHKYTNSLSKITDLKDKSKKRDLTDHEEKELDRNFDIYRNTPAELNARFSEAIRFLELTSKKKTWEEVKTQFPHEFTGWDKLAPDSKRRLLNRLYHLFKDI